MLKEGTLKMRKYYIIILVTIIVCVSTVTGVFLYVQLSNNQQEVETGKINDSITEEEKQSALKDIVFLGDSITEGYVAYEKIDEQQVVHLKGVSANGMFTEQFTYKDYKMYLEDALTAIEPKYLFIGFGMNDLYRTEEEFYAIYKKNIERIQKLIPDTTLVLMSVTPINSSISTNYQVGRLNSQIQRIVNEIGNNSQYVDINSVLADKNGKLSSEYDSGDGIHINGKAYDAIIEYLVENPIE